MGAEETILTYTDVADGIAAAPLVRNMYRPYFLPCTVPSNTPVPVVKNTLSPLLKYLLILFPPFERF